MNQLVIDKEVTMEDVRRNVGRYQMAFYGANTPWWTANECDLYMEPGTELPCDPRGGMLFQTSKGGLEKFLSYAEANVAHYGKHGLRAFLAAYHGVVLAWDGRDAKPTCCDNWDGYNKLLDEYDAKHTDGLEPTK